MEKWIISVNPKYFNRIAAFEEYNYIDWKQTRNFNVGDIVYIYVTRPIAMVKYKTIVEKTNISINDRTMAGKYWNVNQNTYCYNKFVRLKLLKEFDDNILSFEHLKSKGMKYASQSPCILKDSLRKCMENVESSTVNYLRTEEL